MTTGASHLKRGTVSVLTPRGRGAVATLLFEGPPELVESCFRAANGKPISGQPLRRIVFGHWGREVIEDVVISRTETDRIEIHCHGGQAAIARILADLENLGVQQKSWSEHLADLQGSFHQEWLTAISKCSTERTAEWLAAQRTVFPETVRSLFELSQRGESLCERVREFLKWSEFGLHLWQPWNVVLGGPPNVGKSSLINALVGYSRSIVFDQPGTTRDVVTAETAFEGWPIRLADTAGLRDSEDPLESEGIERAKSRLRDADCQILLFDASQPLTQLDEELHREFPNGIRVAHKCDLLPSAKRRFESDVICVSSQTGEGIDELAQQFVNRLIPELPDWSQAIPFTPRQIEWLKLAEKHNAIPEKLRACLASSNS